MMTTNADVLYREMQDIKTLMSDIRTSLQRVQRMTQDEAKMVAHEYQRAERRLNERMVAVTEAIYRNGFIARDPVQSVMEESQHLYQHARARREAEVRQSLAEIEHLRQCRQNVVEKCPCGKHKGIQFIDPHKGTVIATLCPVNWWLKMSRLAYEHGELSKFRQANNLEEYLKHYKLGT